MSTLNSVEATHLQHLSPLIMFYMGDKSILILADERIVGGMEGMYDIMYPLNPLFVDLMAKPLDGKRR